MFEYSVTMFGLDFDPGILHGLSGLDVIVQVCPGDVTRANKVADYGVYSVRANSIVNAVDIARLVISESVGGKIDSVVVEVTYSYEAQCNLEFSTEEISLLHGVGASLAITCYREGQ